MKCKKGVSLVVLVITIIVIIILALISLKTVVNAIQSARFSKFAHEFGEYSDSVRITYNNHKEKSFNKSIIKRNFEYYYEVATNTILLPGMKTTPTGIVSNLHLQTVPPDFLTGNEFYLITSDANINGYSKDKQFYGDNNGVERHYVTDSGVVFTLPGFQYEQDDGTYRYYINSEVYYVGFPIVLPDGDENIGEPGTEPGDEPGDEPVDNAIFTSSDGWKVDPTTNTILGYEGGIENKFEIPSFVISNNGNSIPIKKVESIGSENFENVHNIQISEGVEVIGANAFENFTGAKNLKLPSTLKIIDDYAFSGLGDIANINIPEGVEKIGEGAFKDSGIKIITLPSTITSIGKNAFYNTPSLKRVNINKPANAYTNNELISFGIENPGIVRYIGGK